MQGAIQAYLVEREELRGEFMRSRAQQGRTESVGKNRHTSYGLGDRIFVVAMLDTEGSVVSCPAGASRHVAEAIRNSPVTGGMLAIATADSPRDHPGPGLSPLRQ